MPSEQKHLFFDEKQNTLKKDYDVKNEVVDSLRSKFQNQNFRTNLNQTFQKVVFIMD